jgi:hypothetical protein
MTCLSVSVSVSLSLHGREREREREREKFFDKQGEPPRTSAPPCLCL